MAPLSAARLSLAALSLLATLTASLAAPALADDAVLDPKGWCDEISDLVAAQKIDEVPARAVAASRGEISAESAAGFLAIKVVTDRGNVRANNFLIEKNYNDTLSKIWHLIVFGNDSLYIRCTFVNVDKGWMLFDLSFNTDEVEIQLP